MDEITSSAIAPALAYASSSFFVKLAVTLNYQQTLESKPEKK